MIYNNDKSTLQRSIRIHLKYIKRLQALSSKFYKQIGHSKRLIHNTVYGRITDGIL